jgi:hypothetical protein
MMQPVDTAAKGEEALDRQKKAVAREGHIHTFDNFSLLSLIAFLKIKKPIFSPRRDTYLT